MGLILDPQFNQDSRKKDGSIKPPAQAGSTQGIDRLSNTSFRTLHSSEEHLSPSLRGVGNHETHGMAARLKRRRQSWRSSKVTDLPR